MDDLERATWELEEAMRACESAPTGALVPALRIFNAKVLAYGVACHALTCSLCRGHHDDQCWERKLIMGELD